MWDVFSRKGESGFPNLNRHKKWQPSPWEGVKKSKQLIPRSGTKSRRNAKWKSFLSFATFAYFASLRETGLSIMD
jgi:hypothetical protein